MNERHCHPAATAIALLAFVLAAPVAAQGTSISVYGGLRGSGQGLRSNSQPEQTLRLASSPTLSLALGWPVDPARQLELFASRQQSELKLAAPGTTTTFVPVRLSLLHLGGTNFIGGHITFYAGGIASILPQVKAGRAKCLLLTSAANNPLLPQASGLDALGIGPIETVFWRAIVAPKGTPPEIIAKLEAAFLAAAQKPKFLDYLAGLGEAPASLRGAVLARELRAEYNALGVLTRQVAPR